MRTIQQHIPLKNLNSFGIGASARGFFPFEDVSDLRWFFNQPVSKDYPWYLFSGGNNILLSGDYEGTLLHPVSRKIELMNEDAEYARVKIDAGVEWDDVVAWAVDRGLGGIENLSLIPGYAGAAPVQNIGAYGVELKDTLESVDIYQVDSDEVSVLSAEECRLGYRESIFKHELNRKAIILSITLRLAKQLRFQLDYGDLRRTVESAGDATLRAIRDAVISIRESKLPDPKQLGNAGSFFKNPVVSEAEAQRLQREYPDIPFYPAHEGYKKLATGWMIDRAGWKGFCRGNVGVHEKQALVLVNYGGATGKEVIALAEEIQQSVRQRFGIEIQMEVNVL